MAPISRPRFAGLLRRLSPDKFVWFVADLWDARGWTTDVRDDTVIATRERSTADRHVLLVPHVAALLGRIEQSTDRTDATHVVTRGPESTLVSGFAASLDADVIDRTDLYDMAVYALDTSARETLFQQHFGRSATVDESSGVIASTTAQLRTRRGKLVTLAAVIVLAAAAAGAVSLHDGSPTADGAIGDDRTPVVTSTPEPFTVPVATMTTDADPPTPSTATEERETVTFVVEGTPGSGDHAWHTFRGDPARTGHRPNADGPRGDVGIMARFDSNFEFVASPAVVNGAVYIGAVDGTMYALDARSLHLRWDRYLDGEIFASPAVVNGSVYVGSLTTLPPGSEGEATERLHAMDASSGLLTWNAATWPISFSSPVLVNDSIYVGSMDGSAYSIDAGNGSIRWSAATGGRVFSSPAVSNGTVFVGSLDGRVYALDARTGAEWWNTSTNESVLSTPAVVDETVYVGSMDGGVYALDAENGSVVWRFPTNGEVVSSPAVANGTVYAGSTDGQLYALDAISGDQQWSYSTDRSVTASPIVANGTVYVGATDRRMYALDAGAGDERWSVDLGSRIESSPAVANGVLYVGTYEGHVYALAERSRE